MISRSLILKLKGHTVRIEYRTNRKAIKARIGTLVSITISNLHIDTSTKSGRRYRIPIRSVKNIREVSA